ncbi:hypothetical protein [Sphaerisporangium corydalis]|uniref:Uncharacterized protein n=1 Tax=Sphaerisporangium corydalis TaxID=1441875 RepID=A0ABV9ESB0_9ACTN|nr:hypothetical protein [Sphaerisporangium corydalis]
MRESGRYGLALVKGSDRYGPALVGWFCGVEPVEADEGEIGHRAALRMFLPLRTTTHRGGASSRLGHRVLDLPGGSGGAGGGHREPIGADGKVECAKCRVAMMIEIAVQPDPPVGRAIVP